MKNSSEPIIDFRSEVSRKYFFAKRVPAIAAIESEIASIKSDKNIIQSDVLGMKTSKINNESGKKNIPQLLRFCP